MTGPANHLLAVKPDQSGAIVRSQPLINACMTRDGSKIVQCAAESASLVLRGCEKQRGRGTQHRKTEVASLCPVPGDLPSRNQPAWRSRWHPQRRGDACRRVASGKEGLVIVGRLVKGALTPGHGTSSMFSGLMSRCITLPEGSSRSAESANCATPTSL